MTKTNVLIHPRWPEREGAWTVAMFAKQLGMRLVQSVDCKRLRMVAK